MEERELERDYGFVMLMLSYGLAIRSLSSWVRKGGFCSILDERGVR